jgi:folylpolyglutamate synthase/dihydropteroate synthase
MAAKDAGIKAFSAPTIEKALQTIARHAKTPAIVCICGSLYLAGKVLATNGEK